MAVLKVSQFNGENRALHPSLMPDSLGTTSTNQKPGRGDLRPWKSASSVATVPAGRQTIYRMGRDVPSDTNYWLTWATDVDVVRGFNADDPSERTYFTGSGTPKWTDKARALASAPYPTASRELGCPAPAVQPTVSATTTTITAGSFVVGKSYVIITAGDTDFTLVGAANSTPGTAFTATAAGAGTGTVRNNTSLEDRYYTYTYVSDVGEESGPAPVSMKLTCRSDDTVTISALAAPPAGNYGINRIRIYRTASGSSGTNFLFLRELGTTTTVNATACQVGVQYTIATVGTTDFTLIGASSNFVGVEFVATAAGTGSGTASRTTLSLASTTDDNRALGEIIPSATWLPAPGIPQGGAINYTEPTLTCLTGMWNGMMAGISGRSVRICEAYAPYAWPIAYEILPPESSPVGLGVFGQTLVILTNANPIAAYGGSPDAMDEQPIQFLQACVSKKSIVSTGSGVVWASPDGLCYFSAAGPKLLTEAIMTKDDWQAMNPSSIVGGLYEQRYIGFYTVAAVTKGFVMDPRDPMGMFFLDFGAAATYLDSYQDQLYLLNGTAIQKWDAGTALTTTFKSKEFRFPQEITGFTCGEVIGDASAYPATFKLYADGVLKVTKTVTNNKPFRFNGDYRMTKCNIEVSTTGAIQDFAVAHSFDELGQT